MNDYGKLGEMGKRENGEMVFGIPLLSLFPLPLLPISPSLLNEKG
jgi:hypothetical protein